MEEEQIKIYLSKICSMVNRNRDFSISVNIEFYGISQYSNEKVYKIKLDSRKQLIIFYVEEPAFKYWSSVPCSSSDDFRPKNFKDWPEDKKLTLAWCWCLYRYYSLFSNYGYNPPAPAIL